MKLSSKLTFLLIAGTTVIALAICGFHLLAKHYAGRQQKALLLRNAELNSKIRSIEKKSARLEREVTAQSNRTDAVEEKYEEERKTNDPLRAHIEKMIVQEIKLESQIREKDKDIKRQQDALTKEKEKIESLKKKNQNLTGRLKDTGSSLTELKKELATSKKTISTLKQELESTRRKLEELKAGSGP